MIFLVPLLIVEPLLTLCVVAMAMGYVVSGAIAWVLLKVLAPRPSSPQSSISRNTS